MVPICIFLLEDLRKNFCEFSVKINPPNGLRIYNETLVASNFKLFSLIRRRVDILKFFFYKKLEQTNVKFPNHWSYHDYGGPILTC
jgi:hypothetical protein